MNQATIVTHASQVLFLVLILSLPTIIAASVVGVLISLLQALTQIQEQTLPFAFKLVAAVLTIAATLGWAGSELYNYALLIFSDFSRIQG